MDDTAYNNSAGVESVLEEADDLAGMNGLATCDDGTYM